MRRSLHFVLNPSTFQESYLHQRRLLWLIVVMSVFALASGHARAQGGSCPTTWNSIDPNGNQVSIASYAGITSCYFVSKSTGSDSNSGTSESSPWAHLPGMASCTGNCAGVKPAAGEGFVLRGGDTWTSGDLGVNWNWGGSSSSSQIYIGVDQGWYNSSCGSTWCRPIWNFSGTTNANAFLGNSGASYWWLDNIEMTAMCNGENGVYVQGAKNIRASQLYFHGWTHCVDSDNVGFFSQGGSGSIADHNVIDGSDSSQNTFNGFYSYWSVIQYNYVRYVVSGLIGGSDIVHDNVLTNCVISADGDHANGFFTFYPMNGTYQLIYNNVLAMGRVCAGGVQMWFNGNSGTNSSWVGYGFGNIIYNTTGGNMVNFGNHSTGNYGTYYFFNNSADCTNGGCGGAPSNGPYWSIYDQNNAITGGSYLPLTPPSGGSVIGPCSDGEGSGCTDLSQSESAANAQGYSSTEVDPYSPPATCTSSSNCATVGAGTKLTSVCSGLSSINTNAYNACLQSTTVGVAYNTTTHSVSNPDLKPNTRPTSGNWDIGAYQFSSSSGPLPPTNLNGSVSAQ